MHLNYHLIRQISATLQERLVGFEVVSCFSQEKDELVIGLARDREEFFIKAILTSRFTSLAFPESFHRARANSANIFPDLLGERLEKVVQHLNERSFYLELSGGLILLFKLFGNRSNLILYRDENPRELFHQKLQKDLLLHPTAMDRPIRQDFHAYEEAGFRVQNLFPTFGELPTRHLQSLSFDQLPVEEQWHRLKELVAALERPRYHLIKLDGKTHLSLLPLGEIRETFSDPLVAVNGFVSTFLSEQSFETAYSQTFQNLRQKLQRSQKMLAQAEQKHRELQTDFSFSQTADLIMANLSAIPPQAEEVEVQDFYTGQPRTIKLKPTETPQKYAEHLYRKGKNRKMELQLLEDKISQKTMEVLEIGEQLEKLAEIKDAKGLKAFLKNQPELKEKPKGQQEQLFREFEMQGFKILVGKNAKNNDVLTQKHTFKEDLWLHAKDVSGSHVVIKYQAGKTIPEKVVEAAAELAAYYSKRKNDTLCPVLYTPKKYVRKRKGAEPGAVVVEREKVMLVEPKNPFDQRL